MSSMWEPIKETQWNQSYIKQYWKLFAKYRHTNNFWKLKWEIRVQILGTMSQTMSQDYSTELLGVLRLPPKWEVSASQVCCSILLRFFTSEVVSHKLAPDITTNIKYSALVTALLFHAKIYY